MMDSDPTRRNEHVSNPVCRKQAAQTASLLVVSAQPSCEGTHLLRFAEEREDEHHLATKASVRAVQLAGCCYLAPARFSRTAGHTARSTADLDEIPQDYYLVQGIGFDMAENEPSGGAAR